jgi:hypothetical protein
MGEKGPNKYEREQLRKRKQAERDQYDMSHLGNFKLVYPVLDNPVRTSMILIFKRKKLLGSKGTWSRRG